MNKISMEKLKQDCLKHNINILDKDLEKFDLYGDFLKEYNQKVNLTAILDDDDIAKKHFLDSVIVSKYIDLEGKKMIDVGSGAGFPGVPLKIVNHDLELTLVDSINKKTEFLKALKAHLNLDYQVLSKRAEDLGRCDCVVGQNHLNKNNNKNSKTQENKEQNHREQYDVAVARAVKNLKQLSEYCLPLVKLGGHFVALKGTNNIEQEIDEASEMIKILGGQIVDEIKYKLAEEDNRMIVLIKKISHTPPKYPRLTAQILKKN